ncbi:MAG: hypothetical protein KatS3mg130_0586 [Candidatus Sumerlaea sp.]|nr:MAG: hypothetical protein KatS3mg130_0586 [Candidatus Sumerlaea sp.]
MHLSQPKAVAKPGSQQCRAAGWALEPCSERKVRAAVEQHLRPPGRRAATTQLAALSEGKAGPPAAGVAWLALSPELCTAERGGKVPADDDGGADFCPPA